MLSDDIDRFRRICFLNARENGYVPLPQVATGAIDFGGFKSPLDEGGLHTVSIAPLDDRNDQFHVRVPLTT